MLRTAIQVAAFLQAVMSAVFLVKGGNSMSVKDMAELSTTKWTHNLSILKNLTQQKADIRVGCILLLLSVILQLLHWFLPFGIDDLGINRIGVLIAIIVSIPIYFFSNKKSGQLQNKWYKQAEQILRNPK